MGEITRQPARAIQNALIDSVLAGLCALIVFGPIVGVVLKGYGFTLAPARVAILVAVVMAGRLALSLLLQSHRGKAFIARFEGADDGVYVRPPGYRSRLRWIIPLLVGLAIVFPFLATKYLLTVAILGLIYVLLGLGLNIVVGLAGLLDLGYVAFYAIGAYGLALGYQYLGTRLLGDAAAGGGDGGSRRGVAGLSGAAYAWRLSGHRHPRLWRNYPPGAQQLGELHRGP